MTSAKRNANHSRRRLRNIVRRFRRTASPFLTVAAQNDISHKGDRLQMEPLYAGSACRHVTRLLQISIRGYSYPREENDGHETDALSCSPHINS